MTEPTFRLDRYVPERLLGAGSFATVWLARDEQLGTTVALKVLADNWSLDDEVIQRFLDEARILHRLDHPRFVRVLNVDRLPDGRPYFAMEFADRGSLQQRLDDRTEPFSLREALAVGIEIAKCLTVAHDLGVIHRDLKPSNLLFRSTPEHRRMQMVRAGTEVPDEEMMLADFGLARVLDDASAYTIAAGTPHYMAPEQTQGRADQRSDIYSAAAILHRILVGRPRFAHASIADVARLTEDAPPLVGDERSAIPIRLERLIRESLHPDPDRRPPTAAEFLSALEGCSNRRRPSTSRPSWMRRARRLFPSPRGRPILGSIAGLAAGFGVGLLVQQLGLWPPDALALIVIPALFAFGGNLWGRLAPIRRRRWWRAKASWPANVAAALLVVAVTTGAVIEAVSPSSGSLSPGCTLVASSELGSTTVHDTTRARPFPIDPDGTLVLDAAMVRAPGEGEWRLWLEVAGARIPIASREGRFGSSAAVVVDLGREVDRYLSDRRLLPAGQWIVSGVLDADGLTCRGRAFVRVVGSPFGTVFGFLTLGLLAIGIGMGAASGTRRG